MPMLDSMKNVEDVNNAEKVFNTEFLICESNCKAKRGNSQSLYPQGYSEFLRIQVWNAEYMTLILNTCNNSGRWVGTCSKHEST